MTSAELHNSVEGVRALLCEVRDQGSSLQQQNEQLRLQMSEIRGDTTGLKSDIAGVLQIVRQHGVHLNGTDGEPEKGLVVKVDRLIQQQQTASRLIWILVTVVAGLVLKIGFDLLTRGVVAG